MSVSKILIVDDEPNIRRILAAFLEKEGFEAKRAANGAEALTLLKNIDFKLVLTDLKMPVMDGMSLLENIRELYPHIPVVVITAHGTIETAVEAMKLGAVDFISKPFEQEEIRLVVLKTLNISSAANRDFQPGEAAGKFNIIGRSPGMKEVFRLIEKVSVTSSTVLISGESGTGKELVAKAIHELSPRKNAPFIRINCAAIPHNLLESEFMGFEKGAFTGAVTAKPGKFELAHKGTLFLDEISEMPDEMQPKLLRLIQEKEFERVGGIKTFQADVRIISATNRNIKELVSCGKFREDLFYRLNVVPIEVPPLRTRKEDIPLLIEFFIERFNKKLDASLSGISPEAMGQISNCSFPGNIRELENLIERMMVLCDRNELQISDIPADILFSPDKKTDTDNQLSDVPLKEAAHAAEIELIKSTLLRLDWNITESAKALGVSRRTLQNKIREFGLK